MRLSALGWVGCRTPIGGQAHGHDQPSAAAWDGVDAPVVGRGDGLHDRETQAGSPVGAGADEGVEQPVDLSVADDRPAVLDLQHGDVVLAVRPHADVSAGQVVAGGVLQQVLDEAPEQVRVSGGPHGLQRQVEGPSIEGRRVLVVEDIVDSGLTLQYLLDVLQRRNPIDVRVVALLKKEKAEAAEVQVDRVGFAIPDEFVVGYGLDYAGRYRNLPYVAVLDPGLLGED